MTEHAKRLAREFKKQIVTLLLGAFGFVAALAWNDAIKSAIESLFPANGALWAKFIYAVIFTLLLVLVSLLLLKPTEPEEKKD